MLRWMCGKTRKGKVRNEDIHLQVGITPIEDKLRENHLRWCGHIGCRSRDAHVRRMEQIDVAKGKRLKGGPKMTLLEVIKKDNKLLELEERVVVDRND